jgi:DNA mismatch repair ATPase MutL
MEKKNADMHAHAHKSRTNNNDDDEVVKQQQQKEQQQPEEDSDNKENKGRRHRGRKQQKEHEQEQQQQQQEQEQKSNEEEKKRGSARRQSTRKQQSGSDESSSMEYEKIEPVRMTKFEETEDLVCFSVEPQMSCPPGTRAILEDWWSSSDSEAQSGGEREFKCLSRRDSQVHRLLKQARKGKVVDVKSVEGGAKKLMPTSVAKECARLPAAHNSDF